MVKFNVVNTLTVFVVFISSAISVYIPPTRGGDKCIVLSHLGEYSYNQLTKLNPNKWGQIKGFGECGYGQMQSPIDFPLQVKVVGMKSAPKPKLWPVKLKLHSKVENWALECEKKTTCGYTTYHNKKFYVHSIHFHTPSEHTLNGKRYPLEAHLVHQAKNGDLAVIATMFDLPPDRPYRKKITEWNSNKPKEYGMNKFVEGILHQLMDQEKEEVHMNLDDLTKWGGFCAYNGSLTTPPCSQNVWFFMQMGIQTVAKQQVNLFHKSVGSPVDGINRPIQHLNKRQVTCYLEKNN